MKQLLVLKVGEPPELVPAKDGDVFDQALAIIAGYVEQVRVLVPFAVKGIVHAAGHPVIDRRGRVAYVNEDGRALGLKGNPLASHWAGMPIVGTMVVVLAEGDEPYLPETTPRGRGQTLQE